jgi:23S rRNA (uracil1939-C5)-methyltransferase
MAQSHTPLHIDTLAHNGYGLGTVNGFKIFVIGGVPGDTVTIKIKKKKRRYAIATITEFLTRSSLRTTSPCPHFPSCGGCQIIDISYTQQLTLKESLFKEAYTHLFPTSNTKIRPIIPSHQSLFYRNKMDYAFGYDDNNKIILGLKKRGHYDTVIETTQCQLQDPLTHKLLPFTQEFFRKTDLTAWDYHTNTGCLCHLMVRHSKAENTLMLQLNAAENHPIIYQKFIEEITPVFPEIKSIFLKINADSPTLLYGEPTLTEKIGTTPSETKSFSISPQSFFQTNSKQATVLYNEVKKAAQLSPTDIVYDLYCGTGSIGIYLANSAGSVYGIEEVPEAITNAIQNAKLNNIDNIHFSIGRVKNKLKEIIEGKNTETPKPDCIIIDPPRAGIVPKALHRILTLHAKTVVYVSCNPATLLRDLQYFIDAGYKLNYIQPIDMFPNTFHLEVVVQLTASL